jgi:LmbE family N-acetylglucosaminyl deacetylase
VVRFIAAALLLCLSLHAGARTIVVVPHPDDESIGIAGTIRERLLAGDEVVVVMATHGEASGVKRVLNGESACGMCGRTHNPVAEGFLAADLEAGLITSDGFGNARVREFHAALDALGVPATNRAVYDQGDGKMTFASATSLLNTLVYLYGADADYITVQGSSDTTHRDHIALADALAAHSGIADNRKAYYRVYIYSSATPTAPGQKNIQPYLAAKAAALAAYSAWDPVVGRYMIGRHSVPALITNAASWPYEFPLPPPSGVEDWQLY